AAPHLSAVEQDVCACGASGASSMKSLMKEMWQDLADRQDAFFERVLINQADLLARVNALRDQAAQGVLIPVLPDDCPTLPASSPAEMKALNTYLKKKEKLNQMATYFRQSGGKDHKAAARTVLGLLISNSVAKCCSWAGSHGAKEALLDYGNILELVLVELLEATKYHFVALGNLCQKSPEVLRHLGELNYEADEMPASSRLRP
ncbi:hypothetical protein HPB47_000255, partial [Ixodes persulcatus]